MVSWIRVKGSSTEAIVFYLYFFFASAVLFMIKTSEQLYNGIRLVYWPSSDDWLRCGAGFVCW